MSSYNAELVRLRKEKELTLKQASKGIGITALTLFFYESGYFRPSRKNLKKINTFYESSVSIRGVNAYPIPTVVFKEKKQDKKKLLQSRIVSGTIALTMLAATLTGGFLFSKSVNNADSFYGEVYNSLRNTVSLRGSMGHDLVTGLEYYQLDRSNSTEQANIIFYKTDNLLYFNECSYSSTENDPVLGSGRYHFMFNGSLGVKSNVCTFTYGNFANGSYFTCVFDYNREHVEAVRDFKIIVKGHEAISEELALKYINEKVGEVDAFFSSAISEVLGREVDFYLDFLPAREQGRVINFRLQVIGLFLIIPGLLLFFLSAWIFTRLMIKNVKPRLVKTRRSRESREIAPLPKDINFNFGIPDYFVLIIARLITYTSLTFMVLGFISKLGVFPLPSLFHDSIFLFFLQVSLLTGIFLNHFVVLGRHKKPDALFRKIIYNLYIFLFIATLETVVITITNAWGYDFASLIYKYLPGNVFQIIAVQYIIYLFLFFQPPFLNNKKRFIRYFWHGLSLIPLGFLVFTYFISNAYYLTYGVKENVYINFWFPNGFLVLSVVSILFMYTTFGINLYLERKYGERRAQIYSYGQRHSLMENMVCAIYIVVIGLLDLLFIHNQYGYYLGLGYNYWIFTLLPFIIFCKYSPNRKQTVLLHEELEELTREVEE